MFDVLNVYKELKALSEKVDAPVTLTMTVNEEELFDRVEFKVSSEWRGKRG